MSAEEIRKYVAIANQLKGELVVLTGDFVTYDPAAEGAVGSGVSGTEREERLSQVTAAESGEPSMFIKIAAKITSGSSIGPSFQALRNRNSRTSKKVLQTTYGGRHPKRWAGIATAQGKNLLCA
jgi:hypothetical protein